MKNRRYTYVGDDCVKTFSTFEQMKKWAKDEHHNGTFYISCPDITFKKTRQQIIGGERKRKNA